MDVGYFIFGSLLLVLNLLIQSVVGDVEVLVYFHYFSNPTGRLLNGYCCDGWPFCTSPCDPSFRVCLDLPNWYHSTALCRYGSYQSQVVAEDRNQVLLGDSFGGVTNPMRFIVPGPTLTRVTLKVDVHDVDTNSSNDVIDYLRGDFWLYKGHRSEFRFHFDLIARTRLYTVVSMRCAKGWHGDRCRIYCPPPGPRDHHICDMQTGRKLCIRGWAGPNCTKKLGLRIRTKTKWLDKIKRRSEKAYDALAKIKYN